MSTYAQEMQAKYGLPFNPKTVKGVRGFKFGDRVKLALYDVMGSGRVKVGDVGTVWAIRGWRDLSVSPDPMHKMIFVKWDKAGYESVWAKNLEKVRR